MSLKTALSKDFSLGKNLQRGIYIFLLMRLRHEALPSCCSCSYCMWPTEND